MRASRSESGNQSAIDYSQNGSHILDADKETFNYLFSLYYRQLYHYGFKITANEELVKDCIQELFLVLWKKRQTINEIKCIRAYLISSLRRMVFRQLKKQRNSYERDRSYIDSSFSDTVDLENLADHFETKPECRKRLSDAINSLSNRQKEAVNLKFYDGLNNREIACVMEINLQSVYNHISEAVRQLQGLIGR
ncbi:MAG: sigma-70 family RNA polymerase sigma factor [Balneolales bacterium]